MALVNNLKGGIFKYSKAIHPICTPLFIRVQKNPKLKLK